MKSVARRSEGSWRQITACILVVALMLQGLAFALASNALDIDPSDPANFAGFEICSHQGSAPPAVPGSPAANTHCIFCLAGVSHALGTAPPTLDFHAVVMTVVVSWVPVVWRLPTTTGDISTRPRGPPFSK
jgi:hypothetical protein